MSFIMKITFIACLVQLLFLIIVLSHFLRNIAFLAKKLFVWLAGWLQTSHHYFTVLMFFSPKVNFTRKATNDCD